MLESVRGSHIRIVKCKQRAREALYWPGLSAQIGEEVENCTVCHDYDPVQQKEPLISSPIPDLPWEWQESQEASQAKPVTKPGWNCGLYHCT